MGIDLALTLPKGYEISLFEGALAVAGTVIGGLILTWLRGRSDNEKQPSRGGSHDPATNPQAELIAAGRTLIRELGPGASTSLGPLREARKRIDYASAALGREHADAANLGAELAQTEDHGQAQTLFDDLKITLDAGRRKHRLRKLSWRPWRR